MCPTRTAPELNESLFQFINAMSARRPIERIENTLPHGRLYVIVNWVEGGLFGGQKSSLVHIYAAV